ncbi:unnamed protein product [Rotaria sp. Silwood2]|nr:unnamed protein product [Rotaria sp. Silwood2]
MVSNSEASMLNYCELVSDMNGLKYKTSVPYEKNSTTKSYKDVIDSPTYPKFRVASNTDGRTLESWIMSDSVNFGLIGRYLTEYELAHANSVQGTITSSLMMDIGGNHGTYAFYGATLNQSVHVFEILPVYWAVIKETIRINENLGKKITLHQCGIGDKRGVWKVLPQEGLTRLDFLPDAMVKEHFYSNPNELPSVVSKHNFPVVPVYPLDDFVFRKVSLIKIDVEGFEIRVLKGADRAIAVFGVGALLVEIASNRWSWSNITIDEGISVLEHVTLAGNYSSYIIARNEPSCPASKISKVNSLIHVKNVLMMNMKNGRVEPAPEIYKIIEWEPIMKLMKTNDWSCNFWLEKEFWT